MSELRRIRFVTLYFHYLQGLRLLPLALASLAVAMWMALPGTMRAAQFLQPEGLPILALLGVPVVALYKLLGVYYQQTFGIVRQRWTSRRRVVRAMVTFSVLGMVLGVLKRSGSDASSSLAVVLALSGLSFVWCWVRSGLQAHHYCVAAAGFLVLGALQGLDHSPVCALLRALPFTSHSRCGEVTLFGSWGMALLVLSLLDHWILATTMRPLPQPEPEAAPEPTAAPEMIG